MEQRNIFGPDNNKSQGVPVPATIMMPVQLLNKPPTTPTAPPTTTTNFSFGQGSPSSGVENVKMQPAKITMHIPTHMMPKIVTTSPLLEKEKRPVGNALPQFQQPMTLASSVPPHCPAPMQTQTHNFVGPGNLDVHVQNALGYGTMSPPSKSTPTLLSPSMPTPMGGTLKDIPKGIAVRQINPVELIQTPSELINNIINSQPKMTTSVNDVETMVDLVQNDHFCEVPGCNRAESPNTVLFDAPEIHSREWSDTLGIENNPGTFKVCSNHFDKSQFTRTNQGLVLLPNASPHGIVKPRFPPQNVIAYGGGVGLFADKIITQMETPSNIKSEINSNEISSITPVPPATIALEQNLEAKSFFTQSNVHIAPSEDPSLKLNSKKNVMPTPSNISTSPVKPVQVNATSKNIPKPVSRQLSPEKVINSNKLRGPKCFRVSEPEQRPLVSLGPYSRPNVPIKQRSKDITREELGCLVMPSEDWNVSVYPYPVANQKQKLMYVISETLLNTDLVEIVRKSISIHPNWAMKFSVMATDASHFNLGLAASDITDIQAVLDNFNSLPVCNGILENVKTYQTDQKMSIMFQDKKRRSKQCPLLLVGTNNTDKSCSFCSKLSTG